MPIAPNDNDTTSCYDGRVNRKERVVSSATTVVKREILNLRIKPQVRDLIDRAAKVQGKNRTDFILDAARAAAEDTLLDQALIVVSPEAYAQFEELLDRAPASNARLQKTLQSPAPWDKP